jgi:hypothetical protein
MNII